MLVAEDDESLAEVLARGLREQGYVVDLVPDGETAAAYLRFYQYEVAVLDWRMPRLSGLDLVRKLRRGGTQTPVLMLTARDTPADRIAGLDAGADDYLVKPFDFGELLARLRALQRRPPVSQPPRMVIGELEFDPAAREVTVCGRHPALTGTELGILEILMRRSPGVADRRSIAQHVWDNEADAFGSNTIDVHLARLRSKLAGAGVRIETVRGRRLPDHPGVRFSPAAKVAAGATAVIAVIYILGVIVLNLVVSTRLAEQNDDHLIGRLAAAARQPGVAQPARGSVRRACLPAPTSTMTTTGRRSSCGR